MKKYLKILFVFLLGFMIIPMVNAADLPTEGVTYFLEYPNGEEYATTNYNEATTQNERLIYSGVTDENGAINLCNWASEGQLRIVQHVPDGYTTNEREIRMDLSKTSEASFVDYRGMVNPTTGRSLLVLFGIAGVAAATVLASRKNKKSIMVIPIVTVGLLITAVKAAPTCPCIKVKDGNGNVLVGVQVDIYATPIRAEAAPAIKFDANGGKFFDGTTEMYVRIPNNGCSFNDMINGLGEERATEVTNNVMNAYRQSYRPTAPNIPNELHNGDVIKMNWTSSPDQTLQTLDANGGTITVFGKTYTRITNYKGVLLDVINEIGEVTGPARLIGYDNNQSCNHYSEYGIWDTRGVVEDSEIIYACWNNKPDGIYVNDVLFLGNDKTCYTESDMESYDSGIYLSNMYGDEIYIGDIDIDDIYFGRLYRGATQKQSGGIIPLNPGDELVASGGQQATIQKDSPDGDNITKVEIVKDGVTILSLNGEDFEYEEGNYYILNDEKLTILRDYMDEVIATCISQQSGEPGN